MKKFLFSLCFTTLFTTTALAATITITSDQDVTDPKLQQLTDLPQAFLGILSDQGIPMQDLGGGKYQVEVKDLHCDYYSRGAYDGPISGISTERCKINSEPVKDTTKGDPLHESRALVTLLGKIESVELDIYFTDCGMGYCGTDAKKISCMIDTNIEEFAKGRFTCTLEDNQ